MSRFNMFPREGHLKAAKRILTYLKTFPKGESFSILKKMDGELYDGRQEAIDAVRNYYKQQNNTLYKS